MKLFFLFNKACLVSIETAEQHCRGIDKGAKSDLGSSHGFATLLLETFRVYVRGMKELFKINFQGPTRLRPFTVGGEINENIFTHGFQLRSGAKRELFHIKRC